MLILNSFLPYTYKIGIITLFINISMDSAMNATMVNVWDTLM